MNKALALTEITPIYVHTMTLPETLLMRGQTQPDELAYTFLGSGETPRASLTYGQLHAGAARLAVSLQRSFAEGARIILLYPTGIEFLIAFYACLYARMPAICLPLPKSEAALQSVLKVISESGASGVMTCQSEMRARHGFLSAIDAVCPLLISDTLMSGAHEFEPQSFRDTDIAFLQYTSGSTSDPKGVMVSHANVVSTLVDLGRGFSCGQNSCMVSWLPFFHDMGLIFGLLLPLFAGFPCYFMAPMSFLQRPMRWLKAIDRFRATHSAAPNFAYQMCVEKIPAAQVSTLDLSSWKVALNGAEPVRAEVLDDFHQHFSSAGFAFETFCPGYGMAEASLKIAALECGRAPRFLSVDANALALGRVLPLPRTGQGGRLLVGNGCSSIGARIEIIDFEKRIPVSEGRVGEIWVQSDAVAKGYWRREAATKQVFEAYLPGGDGPFLRTGDLGFVFEGEVYITGRLKDVMVIAGRNHHPEDVEHTVQACHLSLRKGHCAAFSIEIDLQEELVVVAEVNRRYLQTLDAGAVKKAIREAVATNHDVRVFDVVLARPGEVSRTTSGKIQRNLCKKRYIDNQLAAIAVAAQ